jgi:hypothetical protein
VAIVAQFIILNIFPTILIENAPLKSLAILKCECKLIHASVLSHEIISEGVSDNNKIFDNPTLHTTLSTCYFPDFFIALRLVWWILEFHWKIEKNRVFYERATNLLTTEPTERKIISDLTNQLALWDLVILS